MAAYAQHAGRRPSPLPAPRRHIRGRPRTSRRGCRRGDMRGRSGTSSMRSSMTGAEPSQTRSGRGCALQESQSFATAISSSRCRCIRGGRCSAASIRRETSRHVLIVLCSMRCGVSAPPDHRWRCTQQRVAPTYEPHSHLHTSRARGSRGFPARAFTVRDFRIALSCSSMTCERQARRWTSAPGYCSLPAHAR